jgi:hypothetical protein
MRMRSSPGVQPSGETIIKMINNPVCTDVLRYGLSALTTKAQRKQLGKVRVSLDELRYACVEGAVPVTIPFAEWERAQRILESGGTTTETRTRGAGFPLSENGSKRFLDAIAGSSRPTIVSLCACERNLVSVRRIPKIGLVPT